jgi:hypothetical protein
VAPCAKDLQAWHEHPHVSYAAARGLQKQLQQQPQLPPHLDAADYHSSRGSSATQGMPSDDDEVAQQQQQQQQQPKHKSKQQRQSHKQQQKDNGKEWAALTTWLRMNLHHPRTNKRVILFLGHQEPSTGCAHGFLGGPNGGA